MRSLYFIISVAIFSVVAPASLYAQAQVNVLTQQWNGSHWENDNDDTNFIYNSNCQLLYDLFKSWDSSANNWDNYTQYNFSYYGSGKLYQDSVQRWNSPSPGWNNSELLTYTYDGSNYLINELSKTWNTATSSWQTSGQTNYINNTDGTVHLLYSLILSGGVWDTVAIETYIYNTPGQLDTTIDVIHVSGIWQNSARSWYTYDVGYTTMLEQVWGTISNSWQNADLFTYWPSLNMPDSVIIETWNSATSAWGASQRVTNTYTPCTPAAVKQINSIDPIAVYPNPSTGHFTVKGLTRGQTVEIYNYTGQRIESRTADNPAIDFNIAAYASGMYLVRVQNQDGSVAIQKKMVKTQ